MPCLSTIAADAVASPLRRMTATCRECSGGSRSLACWLSQTLQPSLVPLGGQRRQQGAAFTPEAMDSYLPRVEATCREYLARWAAQECIDVQDEVSPETLLTLKTLKAF